jgi:SWI/SNF-related matrix-associated actin-dependent regulator 1 of chromatin subfamily A
MMLKKYKGCCLNADDMGLGKTIQSIELIARNPGKLKVVAVPNFVKFNWVDEFKEFLPDEKLYICGGQKPKSLKGFKGTAIINYDILSYWADEFKKAGVEILICDESHFLKNNTQRTKAAISISRQCKIKILLSGTPIEKNPADLYFQLKIIRPDLFTSKIKFIKRYNSATKSHFHKGWHLGKAINMRELNTTLTKECMFRRLKEEVLPELPEKQRTVISLEIDNRKEYDNAEKNIIAWIRKNTDLNVQKSRKNKKLAELDKLKLISAMGKMKQFVEWVKNESENKKLVIFCHHKLILNRLQKMLPGTAVIKSEMDPRERKLVQNRFNNDDKVRTLLTTIRVGGTGLNFQKGCDTTVFFQLDWNSSKHDQAEDRVYRIGQDSNNVRAIYFIARDSIEQRIMEMIDETRSTASRAIDGFDTDDNELLLKLLSEFEKVA